MMDMCRPRQGKQDINVKKGHWHLLPFQLQRLPPGFQKFASRVQVLATGRGGNLLRTETRRSRRHLEHGKTVAVGQRRPGSDTAMGAGTLADVVPALKSGALVITLDPAAPYAVKKIEDAVVVPPAAPDPNAPAK